MKKIKIIRVKTTKEAKEAEKFVRNNPKLFSESEVNNESIKNIIKKGENEKIEFKSTLRTNLHTKQIDKKIISIIPARMKSGRFPGKPMKKLHGIPMVGHCWYRSNMCKKLDALYVATPDEEIYDYIKLPNVELIFRDTVFVGDVDFCATRFGERTSFIGAQFGERTEFINAQFGEYVNFIRAKFGKTTDFNRANLEREQNLLMLNLENTQILEMLVLQK